MPFDGTDFPPRPERPGRLAPRERIWTAVILFLAFLMLVMPVSAEGVVDVIRYVRGH